MRNRTMSETDHRTPGGTRKRLTKHRPRNASTVSFFECLFYFDNKKWLIQGDETSTGGERERHAAFMWSNERRVDDVVLGFFYKPHTLTLLALVIAALVYLAFTRYFEFWNWQNCDFIPATTRRQRRTFGAVARQCFSSFWRPAFSFFRMVRLSFSLIKLINHHRSLHPSTSCILACRVWFIDNLLDRARFHLLSIVCRRQGRLQMVGSRWVGTVGVRG